MKYWKSIFFVVLIAAIFSGVYFVSKKENRNVRFSDGVTVKSNERVHPEGWKKFESSYLQYTAYYPPTWFAQSSKYDKTDDFVNEEASAPLAMSEKGVWVTISSLSKNNQTLDAVIQDFRQKNFTEQRYEVVSQEEVTIGGRTALRLREAYLPTAPDSEGSPFVVLYVDYGDVVYRALILYSNEQGYKNNQATIEEILTSIEQK